MMDTIYQRTLTIILFSCLFGIAYTTQKWMYLGFQSVSQSLSNASQCSKLNTFPGLSPLHRFCKENFAYMASIVKGTSMAFVECRKQFKWRRWDCSTTNNIAVAKSPFGEALTGTRESAFVSALFAAGISYQVTRDCGRGKIDGCECDNSFQLPKPKANEFRMIGCHENIPFGNAFSRQFISSVELKSKNTARNARSLEDDLVDKHNYEAGRLVIGRRSVVRCKCHGVSGSCEMKICYRTMLDFENVGTDLMDKYSAATFVQRKQIGVRQQMVAAWPWVKKIAVTDLIYRFPSSNYCNSKPDLNVKGTKGRECRINSTGTDSCEQLCCNRGHVEKHYIRTKNCHCQFSWCCKVVCKKCFVNIRKYYCK